jgi:hypothetical protein
LIEERICQGKIPLAILGYGDVFWFFPSKLIFFRVRVGEIFLIIIVK